tara:strand:- start:1237 stop:2913 length:1677 start_codon:yes stop_codon:yes gene_type:complete
MNVKLITSGRIEVYDLQTKFATTSSAPGMKTLCQFAISNGNRIDQESLMSQYNLSESAVRNLFSSGLDSGVWDLDGLLTNDGHETAKTGEVLVDEVGPLRIWVFDHETTGAILLHAERLGLMPPANVDPQAGNSPKILDRLSNEKAVTSLKSGDNRRWRLKWADEESAWAIVSEFCTSATLSWSWRYDDGWVLDDEILFKGRLNGVSRNKSEDGIQVENNYPQTGALNPDVCMREWLSTNRFSSGPWDTSLKGLKRPFSQLSNAEKSMQTTDEILENDAEGWDLISISEIPLFAKTIDDAVEWTTYLINEETPGYTTTEDTRRKIGDILQRQFMCQDLEKVKTRVQNNLSSNRADPRLSKLLHTGDDLSEMALIPKWVLAQKRDQNVAIHDGTDDYTEFVHQITQKMKGKIKRVTYVNNYLHDTRVRKRLAMFEQALGMVDPDIQFEILTSHYPYTKHQGEDRNAEKNFKAKIQNDINAKVSFMDSGKYGEDARYCTTAHDRVIIISSDKEKRFWKVTTKGIHIKDKSPCVKVEQNELEKWLREYLKSSNKTIMEELG